jgi:hypothetical protein
VKIQLAIEIDGHSVVLQRDIHVPRGRGERQVPTTEQATAAQAELEGLFRDAKRWLADKEGLRP